jgi:hypothetical protein
MDGKLAVTLEVGLKGKQVVAVACGWPGLERGAKTVDAAVARLQSYRPRYLPVARLAGLEEEFASSSEITVVEQYQGTGSTDFWGISFAFSSVGAEPLSAEELARALGLMRACWAFFDAVRARVSAQMRKGPRGGGRDRDRIVSHVIGVEQDWAKKVGVGTPDGPEAPDDAALQAYRDTFCEALRAHHRDGRQARNWPLRYLTRHTAYHTLDHAWEMEDKDLSGSAA